MVQVLKEELRLAILKAARNEFLQYGYMRSSVKRIAASVGISTGNLYRYYAGKEALFDSVVHAVYSELERLLNNHEDQEQAEGNVFELATDLLMGIIEEHRESLLILIDRGEGTKYEDAAAKIHKMMADNVALHLAAYNRKRLREQYSEPSAWPIAVAFMEGYFEIIRRHADPETCRSILRQYISFWYQGLRSLFE